ncbi:response regulator [Gracilimonas mengyeensis]|uniref:Response regulator receiver domain-containing protein n=1 Tax=Gracilimonas mengyeensis TaxID=1302730 RepID=A0A521AQR9_9BACT|nr:response regulator [Gracilimonas mengyeensis]SMO37135.1 Response regulator receiver domain-containing protein [Gracilimonas mengyeensis]
MRVLIVEDDKVLSLLLSKMIERLGLEVLMIVTKGAEAIEKIVELEPDLVLMDIMLEDDIDGITVVENIRSKSIDTTVIYITGNSDATNRERANATNYSDYLIKPISFEELKTSIQKIDDPS